jgi:hypothetical protein
MAPAIAALTPLRRRDVILSPALRADMLLRHEGSAVAADTLSFPCLHRILAVCFLYPAGIFCILPYFTGTLFLAPCFAVFSCILQNTAGNF